MTYTSIDDVRGDGRIDSRDLIELRAAIADELNYTSADSIPSRAELRAAIDAIDALADDVGDEWPYGAHLIREDRFEDYARELAEDIGAIDRDTHWPNDCIDWERAARELAMDYTSVDFLGYSYYVR